MRQQQLKSSITIIFSLLLAACGGGGDANVTQPTSSAAAAGVPVEATMGGTGNTSNSGSVAGYTSSGSTSVNNSTANTNSSNAVASVTLGDCFTWTPGTKFNKSNFFKTLIVQEAFEGQTAIGAADLRFDDSRFSVMYQAISGGAIHLLGLNQYDSTGALKSKVVYSAGAQMPADMTPGQSVQMNYTTTLTTTATNAVTTANISSQYTFAGLENLTLGGRTFSNACKVKEVENGQVYVTWFAKGFGAIHSERQDATGATVSGSQIELTSIVAAP